MRQKTSANLARESMASEEVFIAKTSRVCTLSSSHSVLVAACFVAGAFIDAVYNAGAISVSESDVDAVHYVSQSNTTVRVCKSYSVCLNSCRAQSDLSNQI